LCAALRNFPCRGIIPKRRNILINRQDVREYGQSKKDEKICAGEAYDKCKGPETVSKTRRFLQWGMSTDLMVVGSRMRRRVKRSLKRTRN
jgi:hypothetical protein